MSVPHNAPLAVWIGWPCSVWHVISCVEESGVASASLYFLCLAALYCVYVVALCDYLNLQCRKDTAKHQNCDCLWFVPPHPLYAFALGSVCSSCIAPTLVVACRAEKLLT